MRTGLLVITQGEHERTDEYTGHAHLLCGQFKIVCFSRGLVNQLKQYAHGSMKALRTVKMENMKA